MELTDYFGALPVAAIFHSHRDDMRVQVTATRPSLCGGYLALVFRDVLSQNF